MEQTSCLPGERTAASRFVRKGGDSALVSLRLLLLFFLYLRLFADYLHPAFDNLLNTY